MRSSSSARAALLAFASLGVLVGCNAGASSGLPGASERTTQSSPLVAQKIYVVNNGDNTVRTYRPDGTQTIPTITGLNGPRGVAVDANGKIYVASFVPGSNSSNMVTTYLPDGTQTTPTITQGLCGPDAVAIDRHFKIYVVNVCGGVTIYKADGTPDGEITAGLNGPQGITIDSHGKIYVTNYSYPSGQSFMTTYDQSGMQIQPTITAGLNFPEGILVDAAGKIYIANFGANDVTTYRADGTQLSTITAGLVGPEGMAFNDGKFYVANINGGDLTTYRKATGKETAPTISGLSSPIGVAFH